MNLSLPSFRSPVFVRVLAIGFIAIASASANTPARAADKFPLEYRIIDPDNSKNDDASAVDKKLSPLIVMFPEGKTSEKKDATGPIGRLEGFRGKSKMLPESNDDPGLPVVLYGLRFLERRDADNKVVGYDVELQGEYNAVKVAAPTEAMQEFLAGKRATFSLESNLQYGVISTQSKTKLELSRSGDKIYVWSVEGDFTFREGFTFYKSATLKTSAPSTRKYLYYGEQAKLPALRIL